MLLENFPFRSLRDWTIFLEKQDDIVFNREEVDLWGDMAAISKKIAHTEGPAVLHQNINGYPGWRIFSDGLTTRRRMLWALNLPTKGYIQEALERMSKASPIKPAKVANGPCKEIKLSGDDIDLVKFPHPLTGSFEGAPYITAGISFVKDPETEWINSAVRRFQVIDRDKTCILVSPAAHEGMIFAKYKQMGKPMPISICIGADPLVYLASLWPSPAQFSEMDNWGLFSGQPLEVVVSETNNITVPASSEIVIEGEVHPDMVVLEGPFAEFTGYYSGFRKCPVLNIKAITLRSEPIYQYMCSGPSAAEGHNIQTLARDIELYRQLKVLFPQLADVAILSTGTLTVAVSINKKMRTPGLEKRLAMAVKTTDAGRAVKNLFIVDDDVDVRNINEILWSLSVKFQPEKDILVVPETPGLFLDPSETVIGPGTTYTGLSSFAAYFCLDKLPPYDEGFKRGVSRTTEEAEKRVEDNWTKYGFKK